VIGALHRGHCHHELPAKDGCDRVIR
jgi:hypothetical protein